MCQPVLCVCVCVRVRAQHRLVATQLTAPPQGWPALLAQKRTGLSAAPVSPLQGKEEFEKTQKELLEKGSITRQGKSQLELQQVRPWSRARPCLAR